ncbi:hypothetical protein [Streptomyces camelliae]|uniref:Uncharacterized protein n=1 Tax=Streptomyces camelliae TaxID=3004093 RepID=A0ABY7NWZ2_9ACTN|nr:hypothetical protein [Streptomyces sp. HUAS 2-6]WBO61774.1 hypothetical protein O1G22_02365 [Streptomyces sp. HUAS 2-6]
MAAAPAAPASPNVPIAVCVSDQGGLLSGWTTLLHNVLKAAKTSSAGPPRTRRRGAGEQDDSRCRQTPVRHGDRRRPVGRRGAAQEHGERRVHHGRQEVDGAPSGQVGHHARHRAG